jgi:hypothetical protein
MKLNENRNSTRQQTSKDLIAPNPPTPEMVERAQFVDKTYRWNGR